MSKWAWIQEYEKDARAKGDAARLRMVQVGREAWGHRESDPARAQALYEEGLRMAQQLAEPWWAMYYTQRRIQARMFWCDHFDDALGWAVESALEARKPQYASFPLRFSVYFKLVFGYASVDAAGYAAEIRQALNSLEHDVPRFNLEDHFLLEFAKRQFALGLDDMEGVEQSAARSLRLAEDGAAGRYADYHLAFVYEDLCGANFRRGDWEALAENAALGEVRSRRAGEQLPLSECQLWQALLALRAGEEVRARAVRRPAVARMSRLKQRPTRHWFNALCAWALHENDAAAALRVRDEELATIVGRGQLGYECCCHVERCRLLARMGRPLDEAMAAARDAAGKLRDPAPCLAELDRIARGETAQDDGAV